MAAKFGQDDLSIGTTPVINETINNRLIPAIILVFLSEKFGLNFPLKENISAPARNSHNLDGSI